MPANFHPLQPRPPDRSRRPPRGPAVVGALVLAAMAAGVAFGALPARAEPADDARKAAVKAAFVYNFAKFATWPVDRFASLTDPVRLCVQRGDLAEDAWASLQGRKIAERPVEMATLPPDADIRHCHIFFAGGFADGRARAAVLDMARRRSVLLVSDEPGFSAAGGHIGLIEDRGRLRFQVNLQSVTRAGIRLSSKLLQLAEIVGPVRD